MFRAFMEMHSLLLLLHALAYASGNLGGLVFAIPAGSAKSFIKFMNCGLFFDLTNVTSSFEKKLICLCNIEKNACEKEIEGISVSPSYGRARHHILEGCMLRARLLRQVTEASEISNSKV